MVALQRLDGHPPRIPVWLCGCVAVWLRDEQTVVYFACPTRPRTNCRAGISCLPVQDIGNPESLAYKYGLVRQLVGFCQTDAGGAIRAAHDCCVVARLEREQDSGFAIVGRRDAG